MREFSDLPLVDLIDGPKFGLIYSNYKVSLTFFDS